MSVAKFVARVAPFLLMLPAIAESRFCIGGNVEQMNAAQVQMCQQQLQQMRTLAKQQDAPDWHYVLVCDEQGWKDYAAFSNTKSEILQNAAVDTNVAEKTTFVRASHLQGTLNQIFSAEVANIIRQTNPQVAMNRLSR